MDAQTGEILWTTAVPNNGRSNPITVANGVLAGSQNPKGPNETGTTVFGGMSVSNGCFYVGHGYRSGIGVFNPNNTARTSLFACCTTNKVHVLTSS
ncbi:hypothetical protein K7X08_030197 [Anisodus acutangulus]|uniref:Uncharacterized protein n=1 Tax=Anisodus acutangulus TaxID=402998 RepID=A0A9Q1R358_9SOLA|nr:hypothetical protein K7X08_030197 [Anisodus acutangulus]